MEMHGCRLYRERTKSSETEDRNRCDRFLVPSLREMSQVMRRKEEKSRGLMEEEGKTFRIFSVLTKKTPVLTKQCVLNRDKRCARLELSLVFRSKVLVSTQEILWAALPLLHFIQFLQAPFWQQVLIYLRGKKKKLKELNE